MAYTSKVIEMPATDSVQIASPGEVMTWTQNLLFTATPSDPATEPPWCVWQVLADPLVPSVGLRYCGDRCEFDKTTKFVCRNVRAQPVPQSPYAWTIQVTWTTRDSYVIGREYFKITRSTGFRTAGMYRNGDAIWTGVPSNGTVAYPPTSWMGGTKVDMNGQPVQLRVAQQSISVDILWDRTKMRSTDAMAGAVDSPDPPSEWTSVYCNTRNDASFLGWPAGYVTYLGWTASQSPDEWLVISHKFLADDWQHLEQRPAPNAAGKPFMTTANIGSSPSIPVQQHMHVFWYQPYVALTNFQNLLDFDAEGWLWSSITEPQPGVCDLGGGGEGNGGELGP